MKKAELIEAVAAKTSMNKGQVEAILDAFEAVVISALQKGDEVTLTGFGTFLAKERSARMGVNPQKPAERIQIPSVTVPKFKAGKTLKDALKTKAAPVAAPAPAAPQTPPAAPATPATPPANPSM